MKAILLSILLAYTLTAQNVWYVDRDATGSANGTSWANAWTTISSANRASGGVNYDALSAGDTIYVSGGTDSTVYGGTTNIYPGGAGGGNPVTFAGGNPVVIAPAWHSGHNGDVYFKEKDNNTQWILKLHNISNIKFTGFNFIDTRTANYGTMLYVGGWGADGLGLKDSLMFFENCNIIGSGLGSMIYIEGYKVSFKNCIIEQAYNSFINDQDIFGIAGGLGGVTIDGCRLVYRNDATNSSAHRDFVQFSDFGSGDHPAGLVVDNVIKNNLMLLPYDANSWNAIIYLHSPEIDCNFYIYNNILVSTNTLSSVGPFFMYQPLYETYSFSAYVFNNTTICNSPASSPYTVPIGIESTDSLLFKNNIVIMDNSVELVLRSTAFTSPDPPNPVIPYYRKVDYNAYFEFGGLSGAFYSGERFGTWTYEQWQNAVFNGDSAYYDANSVTGNSLNVLFTDKYSESKEGYYTETGRDIGVNMVTEHPELYAKLPDMAYDALGNPRGVNGAWDMGALEYQGVPSNSINLKGKVFLQGPFNTNSMATSLTQNSFIPNSQPYNQPPWNYNGNESFNPGSNPTVVDWVLVELRNASNPSQIVARRAALLKNNGLLLETNGTEGVNFNNTVPGSYYIAIYHRNHLAIMSASPVQLSSNSTLYDFTTAMNKAYGQEPMVELASGKYGMYASDGNGDGLINITDYDDIYLSERGSVGYKKGDFNLDSGVSVHDVNLFYNVNNGKETQVPNYP